MEPYVSAIMRRGSHCIYASLIICILLQVLGGGILALNPDGEALLAFKSGLNDSGKAMANWRHLDADPCHWTGVTCNSFKRVMSLNLPYRGLRGSISPSLGNLQELRRLRLHKNNLYGHIPTEIGNCSKLRALYLQSNFLSGPIPIELGKALEIRFLDISRNALTGSIPPSLGNLMSLKHLNLSANFLEGRIPNLGVLSKFPKTSFVGNLDLCGEQIDLICKSEVEAPYPSVGPSENASTKVYVRYVVNGLVLSVMTTLGFSFAVVVLCLWGYFFYNKVRPQNKVPKASMATGMRQNTSLLFFQIFSCCHLRWSTVKLFQDSSTPAYTTTYEFYVGPIMRYLIAF